MVRRRYRRSRLGANRGEISDTRRHHPLLIISNFLILSKIFRSFDVIATLYTTFPAFHEGF